MVVFGAVQSQMSYAVELLARMSLFWNICCLRYRSAIRHGIPYALVTLLISILQVLVCAVKTWAKKLLLENYKNWGTDSNIWKNPDFPVWHIHNFDSSLKGDNSDCTALDRCASPTSTWLPHIVSTHIHNLSTGFHLSRKNMVVGIQLTRVLAQLQSNHSAWCIIRLKQLCGEMLLPDMTPKPALVPIDIYTGTVRGIRHGGITYNVTEVYHVITAPSSRCN